MSVSYSPTSTGGDTGTLTIDEGAAGTDTFSLSGTGVAHRFIFTNQPTSSDFADTAVGDTSGSKQITVTNNTDYPDNPNVHRGGSDPGEFNESDNCDSNVANECMATVSFQPTSSGGKSMTLQIDGDSFTFTGTGIAQFDVSPLSLSFGTQRVNTTSPSQPITFTNHRNNAVNVNVNNGNPADYTVDASDCAGSLPAGQQCVVAVAFQPNATGSQPGTVTVQGQSVSLTGTGTLPVAAVSPNSIGFGNQPIFTASNVRTITVTNNGNENLGMSQSVLAGQDPGQFTLSDNCAAAITLAPGDQCTMTVQYIPSTLGGASAVVQVNDSAPDSPQTVNLSGTGTPSAVVFSPAPVAIQAVPPRRDVLDAQDGQPDEQDKQPAHHLEGAAHRPESEQLPDHRRKLRRRNTPARRQLQRDRAIRTRTKSASKGASLTVNDNGANVPHVGRAHRPRDLSDGRRGGARRGGLRRDQDHVEAGRARRAVSIAP